MGKRCRDPKTFLRNEKALNHSDFRTLGRDGKLGGVGATATKTTFGEQSRWEIRAIGAARTAQLLTLDSSNEKNPCTNFRRGEVRAIGIEGPEDEIVPGVVGVPPIPDQREPQAPVILVSDADSYVVRAESEVRGACGSKFGASDRRACRACSRLRVVR